jgi:hypothetical protein
LQCAARLATLNEHRLTIKPHRDVKVSFTLISARADATGMLLINSIILQAVNIL